MGMFFAARGLFSVPLFHKHDTEEDGLIIRTTFTLFVQRNPEICGYRLD